MQLVVYGFMQSPQGAFQHSSLMTKGSTPSGSLRSQADEGPPEKAISLISKRCGRLDAIPVHTLCGLGRCSPTPAVWRVLLHMLTLCCWLQRTLTCAQMPLQDTWMMATCLMRTAENAADAAT